MKYTLPVVVFSYRKNGKTESLIATFVVLNDEGWVLTASHVIEHARRLEDSKLFDSRVAEIKQNSKLNKKEQKEKIQALGTRPKNPVQEFSIWWGHNEWKIENFSGNSTVDLAVGKILGFQKNQISDYPVFKNPTVNFHPGEALCKLGFPFHKFDAEYEKENNRFFLPPKALPFPLFPIEGIFTRVIETEQKEKNSSQIRFIETSSPGLRGQSGGPTFDVEGRIWAIQSRTVHYPLDFSPVPPGGGNKEHQFLNVGVGTHSETVIQFLDSLNIRYNLSEN